MTDAQSVAGGAAPHDIQAATAFLRLLDPNADRFTFQTFDDDKTRETNRHLARIVTDLEDLVGPYEQGAGVFVTVNETDLRGRKLESIRRVRAVWQEDDDDGPPIFPLPPSMVIESSPRRFHRYWLVEGDWPADEQGRRDFAAVMERMVAAYGSDNGAKDISRVLRLPGYLHRKIPTKPHMVRIVEASGERYTREEILLAFPPPVERRAAKAIVGPQRRIANKDRALDGLLRTVANAQEGDRNKVLYWATCRAAELDDIRADYAAALLAEAASRAGLSRSESLATIKSGYERIRKSCIMTSIDISDQEVKRSMDRALSAPLAPKATVSVDEFVAFLPTHSYIYLPTGAMWPAASVNSQISAIDIGGDGKLQPNVWLDKNCPRIA